PSPSSGRPRATHSSTRTQEFVAPVPAVSPRPVVLRQEPVLEASPLCPIYIKRRKLVSHSQLSTCLDEQSQRDAACGTGRGLRGSIDQRAILHLLTKGG